MVSGKGNKAALRIGAYQQETSAWKVPRHLKHSTNIVTITTLPAG